MIVVDAIIGVNVISSFLPCFGFCRYSCAALYVVAIVSGMVYPRSA